MVSPATSGQDARLTEPRVLIPFIIVTLIWGTTWIVIKDQLGVVPAGWSVTYRFLVGALVMFGVALLLREPLRMTRQTMLFVLVLGVAQFTLNFNFVYRAEHHITSGLVALVFALLFVPNAVLARIFLGQGMSARFLAGSLLAIIGLILLFIQEWRANPGGQGETLLGIGFTLAGITSASSANVMQASETARRLPMNATLAWAMLAGALADGLFAWTMHGPPAFEDRAGYWLGILYLGALGSAVCFPLYFGVIRAVGPARAAYSSVLIPIIAMAISTLVEGYQWTLLSVSGSIVALVGMVVALGGRR